MKGCGCLGTMAAVIVVLVLAVLGIGAGGVWVSRNLLSAEPQEFEKTWSSLDEASCLAKLSPVGVAVKADLESEREVGLTEKELNYLITEQALKDRPDSRVFISLADDALGVRFSHKVTLGKYVNGEMTLAVSGKNNEFQVQVQKFVTGKFTWPPPLLKMLESSIARSLQEQTPLQAQKIRITGIEYNRKKIKLTIKTLKK